MDSVLEAQIPPKLHGSHLNLVVLGIQSIYTNQLCGDYTLPETNSSSLKIGFPNRKVVFQPYIFRGELLVSGRVINHYKDLY